MNASRNSYRLIASLVIATCIANILAPTIQYTFAASTQYYVNATGGSDLNDGLTPATAWQTLSKVAGSAIIQGDTVSLLCGENWGESITGVGSGSLGFPIIFNRYGTCNGSNNPVIQGANLGASSFISLNQLTILASTGSALIFSGGTDITLQNSTIIGSGGISLTSTRVTNLFLDTNTFSGGNTAIQIFGGSSNISANTFTNFSDSAIVFAQNTSLSQNTITNACMTGGTSCAAIMNNPALPPGTSLSGTISQNTIKNIGSSVVGGNHGIKIENAKVLTIQNNTIQNAEDDITLIDASSITLTNNTFLLARRSSLSVIQNTPGSVMGLSLNGNTLYQRNIDYPYIEMRDEVPGSGIASLVSANGNSFITLYKPDMSYVRSVKFGGSSVEYTTKLSLSLFDTTSTTFQSFGYMPYTNTGSYVTANLLTNPSFESNITGWTASAMTGIAASLSQKIGGSYSGNSLLITPIDVTPDRMWISNNAVLSLTSGQVYEVNGYLKSTQTGTLNIRAFLHQSGNMTNIYSDRIAETYTSGTGGVFQFYLYATSTVTDGELTFETSNQNSAFELDEVSFRRKNIVTKNTNVNEVLVFSNTGNTVVNQACPSGIPCAQYVDTSNANIGWPGSNLTVPAFSSVLALWNNSSNLLTVPVVSMSLDSGSIPSGTDAHVTWAITGSTQSSIAYTTSTGSVTLLIGNTGSLYFQPPPGATTSTHIYTQNDIGSRINKVDVTTTNTPPIVYPVTITGNEDDPLIVGTLTGIDQNPGDSVFFEKFTNPANGSISVDISGTASYTPNPNFCGTDSFLYRAYDQFSNFADPVTATLSVNCVNDPPVAVNDSYTETGFTLIFDPRTNDTDVDNPYIAQIFSLSGFTQPVHGVVILTGGILQYTPNNGYIGTDALQYRIQDQSGALSNTGTININVAVPDTAPTDSGAVYVTAEDTPLSNTLSGSDINGDPLSFTVSTLPIHGTVNLVGATFTYTPSANYNGTDTFIYQVFDGFLYSSGASIDFNITPVPDAPVTVNDSFSLLQDTALFLPVMNNDYDVDSASGLLSLTGFTNPIHGSIVPTATGFLYTPNMTYSGTDIFTYRLVDETMLLSNIATVNLNITPSNTPPVASGSTFSLNEDTVFTGSLPAYDPESATLSYTIDTIPTQGVISVTATGVFSYVPNANYNGSDSFTFHVNDGMFDSNIATIALTILPVNDPPIAYTTSYMIAGNSYASNGNIFAGTLSGTDIDSSVLTFTSSTLPIHGILSLMNSGSYTYNPAYGYTGSDSFTYLVNDGQGGISNTGVVNFIMSGTNSAPFAATGTYMTNEDTATSFTLSGSDPDGDTISFILDSSVATGTLALQASGTVNFTPTLNFNGTLNFTYHTSDGLLSSPVRTISIDVLPVNDAPSVNSGNFTITGNILSDSGYTAVFTSLVSDVDSSIFSFTLSTLPSNGTVSMTASGIFTYTPNIGYVGVDTFGYRANDGLLQSSLAIVSITSSAHGSPSTPSIQGAISGPGGGGGGGGGGGSSSSNSLGTPQIFSSAPVQNVSRYQTINGTIFISNDLTGLTSQLMLMNREMNNSGRIIQNTSSISSTNSRSIGSSPSIVTSMIPRLSFADDTSVYLRTIVRYALGEADTALDPARHIESTLIQIDTINTRGNIRLALTKEYALRVLQFHQRMYEEMVSRDLNSAPRSTSRSQNPTDDTGLDDIIGQLSL